MLVAYNESTLQNIHPFEDGSGQARLRGFIHALNFSSGITFLHFAALSLLPWRTYIVSENNNFEN